MSNTVEKLTKLKTVTLKAIRGNGQSSQILAMRSQDVNITASGQFNNNITMKDLAEWAKKKVKENGFKFEECYADEKLELYRVVSIGFGVGNNVSRMSSTYSVKERDDMKTLDDMLKDAVHFHTKEKLDYLEMTNLRITLNTNSTLDRKKVRRFYR